MGLCFTSVRTLSGRKWLLKTFLKNTEKQRNHPLLGEGDGREDGKTLRLKQTTDTLKA